jgi:hypothetical protein
VPKWIESQCVTVYADERYAVTEDCEVVLNGDRMVIDATSSNEGWLWEGEDIGAGQYRFWCAKTDGEGTLNRSACGTKFEGSWSESRRYGMWKVTLGVLMRESDKETLENGY